MPSSTGSTWIGARESMTAEAFAEIWREGSALTLAEAVAEAEAVD